MPFPVELRGSNEGGVATVTRGGRGGLGCGAESLGAGASITGGGGVASKLSSS